MSLQTCKGRCVWKPGFVKSSHYHLIDFCIIFCKSYFVCIQLQQAQDLSRSALKTTIIQYMGYNSYPYYYYYFFLLHLFFTAAKPRKVCDLYTRALIALNNILHLCNLWNYSVSITYSICTYLLTRCITVGKNIKFRY